MLACQNGRLEHYNEYRLGDIVFDRVHPWYPMNHCKYYEKSIACEYLKSISNDTQKFYNQFKDPSIYNHEDVLIDIVRRRMQKIYANMKDQIAIHLRLGDVVDSNTYKHLCQEAILGCKFLYPISFYKQLNIPLNLKITIFTNTRKGNYQYATNSHAYILNILQVFSRHNISVIDDQFADDDLLSMMTYKYLLPSRGGRFSHLLSKLSPHFNVSIVNSHTFRASRRVNAF